MSDEIDILKQLQEENKRLKLALADAVLEKDVYKKTIELAERDGIVLKKNINGSPLQSSEENTQLKGSAPTTK